MAELITKWFEPDTEKKCDEPKSFKIKPLNSVQLWEINSHMKLIDSDHIGIAFEGQKVALKYGLIEWKNVNDEQGEPVPCNSMHWQHVGSWSLNLVAREIIHMSEMQEAERKN